MEDYISLSISYWLLVATAATNELHSYINLMAIFQKSYWTILSDMVKLVL